jgi:hypothetical protein
MDSDVKIILSDLGKCSVTRKNDFIDLLIESGIPVSNSLTSEELVEVFTDNIDSNKELLIGAAYLCAFDTSSLSFDGERVVDNSQVHKIGKSLFNYFDMGNSLLDSKSETPEEYSEIAPFLVAAASKLKNKFGKNRSGSGGGVGGFLKRKQESNLRNQHDTVDIIKKREDAKQQMLQAIIQQRQAQQIAAQQALETKRKNQRMLIIGGSVVAVTLAIIGVVVVLKRRKN